MREFGFNKFDFFRVKKQAAQSRENNFYTRNQPYSEKIKNCSKQLMD
jgi:hypothetical protein